MRDQQPRTDDTPLTRLLAAAARRERDPALRAWLKRLAVGDRAVARRRRGGHGARVVGV